jgi:CheY-like chemotaxis protein
MSIAAKITPHLPYLRRFGRALTGSQESGDAYVVALLETYIAEPDTFLDDEEPRVALYNSFLKIWNSVDLNHQSAQPRLDEPAQQSLDAISAQARQAFLLTSVEGFTPAQTARVLEQSPATVARLLEQAGQEIAEQIETDVLIIEDEPLIAMDLQNLVEGLGHRVVGMARTHREAIAAAKAKRPGLILADIQLADNSSGLEAVNEILLGFEIPVIFITAFPERLLTGQRAEPTFLLTKPFDVNMVRALISQALFFDTRASAPQAKQPTAKVDAVRR